MGEIVNETNRTIDLVSGWIVKSGANASYCNEQYKITM